MIGSYGSIYQLGHKEVAEILNGSVELTEKIDGSQISFGVVDNEINIRSKNQQIHVGSDNGMFNLAVVKIYDVVHLLHPNWIYRGEYLSKPKHNTLKYDRVPKDHVIIYDIERGPGSENYLPWNERDEESARIGFEAVSTFYSGTGVTLDDIKFHLEKMSVLGGVKVEGVVIKSYSMFTADKKVAKAKFVSAEFQEKHQTEWKKSNPTRTDIIEELIKTYKVPARYQKAVQHLRDDGTLEGSPRDIGTLIKEAQEDLKKEEAEAIKDVLFKHFFPQISRGVASGIPTWYKEQLAEGNI